jgi:hypothetical protein
MNTRLTESGDEAVQQDMEDRANSFDPAEWWKHKIPSLTETAITGAANAVNQEVATLYNPYEGNEPCGRQLGESVDEFLERLPPATTPMSEDRSWIYVANPFRKAKKPKDEGELAEAPPDDESHVSIPLLCLDSFRFLDFAAICFASRAPSSSVLNL